MSKSCTRNSQNFLANEDFLWNSGIFIWKIKGCAQGLRASYLPELYNLFNEAAGVPNTEAEEEAVRAIYMLCPGVPSMSVLWKNRTRCLLTSARHSNGGDLGTGTVHGRTCPRTTTGMPWPVKMCEDHGLVQLRGSRSAR